MWSCRSRLSDRQNVSFSSNRGADDLRMIEPAHIFDKAVPLTNVIQRVGLASKNSACSYSASEKIFFGRSRIAKRAGARWANDTFEAAAIEREFGFKNRPLMVHYRTFQAQWYSKHSPLGGGMNPTC